jgi:hypothetical protein
MRIIILLILLIVVGLYYQNTSFKEGFFGYRQISYPLYDHYYHPNIFTYYPFWPIYPCIDTLFNDTKCYPYGGLVI